MPRKAPVYAPIRFDVPGVPAMPTVMTLPPAEAAADGAVGVKDAARFLALCERSLRSLIASKAIPSHRRGRKVILFRRDLTAYLAAERTNGGAP